MPRQRGVGFVNAQHVAAPEAQQKKLGGFSSDMYSLGMTICAIYNQGRPLIQANHSCSDYLKQLEAVSLVVRRESSDATAADPPT